MDWYGDLPRDKDFAQDKFIEHWYKCRAFYFGELKDARERRMPADTLAEEERQYQILRVRARFAMQIWKNFP